MILHSDWEGNDCIRKLRCHCIQIFTVWVELKIIFGTLRDWSQLKRLFEIKPPLQNQLCMQRRIFQENNPLLSQNTKSQSDDDFLGCCPSPVYLILGSSWDPLVPDPAFDRHFPSYWMDKCKTSSMIAKCGKIFCCNFVGYLRQK